MLTNWLILLTILQASAFSSDDARGFIGVRIGVLDHRIQRVYANTPAARAGLQSGDKIISVRDEDNRKNIEGFVGSEVVIVVKRKNEQLTFKMKRESEAKIVRK